MSAQIINGKQLAQNILDSIKKEISEKKLEVTLAIIQIGHDEATKIYVKNKLRRAEEVGIKTKLHVFDANAVKQEEILNLIDKLNNDQSITGFFIQTPIPSHLILQELVEAIDPTKDVDGMHPESLGKLVHGKSTTLVSATALAVLEAIRSVISDKDLAGKHAVIVGRSLIVGKPLQALLLNKDCTVSICHSKTRNLTEICKQADILITATGKENLITKEFVKKDAVVIDCGSPKAEVNFEEAMQVAGAVTPVPGGIGPLTIACLLRNCLTAKFAF